MFDDIVLLDDRIVAEGKNEGRKDGKARGFKDGEGMGMGKGFRVAAEMGFCRGCCLAWLALHEEDPGENVSVRFFFPDDVECLLAAVIPRWVLSYGSPRVCYTSNSGTTLGTSRSCCQSQVESRVCLVSCTLVRTA